MYAAVNHAGLVIWSREIGQRYRMAILRISEVAVLARAASAVPQVVPVLGGAAARPPGLRGKQAQPWQFLAVREDPGGWTAWTGWSRLTGW